MDVGPMGIGTWSWGDARGWGDYDTESLLEAFDACVASGIRLFDTAEVYGAGASERLLGGFVKRRAASVAIATKFAPLRRRLVSRSLRDALRASLARLQLGRLALYQMHWASRWVSIERWMGTMVALAREGLIDAIGVANYSREQVQRAHDALTKHGLRLASIQVEYSLLCRRPETDGVVSLCRDIGATLIAYSPIGMGLLSGKYSPDRMPTGELRGHFTREYVSRLPPLLSALKSVGEQHGGKTPSQVALNWVMRKGAVPIPGVKNKAQALEAVGACGWQLSASEVAALDRASMPFQS